MQELKPPFRNELAFGMSWDDYRSAVGVNPSWIAAGLESMLNFHDGDGVKETSGMRVGSAAHSLVFEEDYFHERYAIFGGTRRKGSRPWEEWQFLNEGKDALSAAEYDSAKKIAHGVRRSELAVELIKAGKPEVSIFSQDFGMQCKGRTDLLAPTYILDLKTTARIDADGFGKTFTGLHYAMKMSCYLRWTNKLLMLAGKPPVYDVWIIAVKSSPPYDCTPMLLPPVLLQDAWPKAARVLKRIPECVKSGHWPGISDGKAVEIKIPNWAMGEETEFTG